MTLKNIEQLMDVFSTSFSPSEIEILVQYPEEWKQMLCSFTQRKMFHEQRANKEAFRYRIDFHERRTYDQEWRRGSIRPEAWSAGQMFTDCVTKKQNSIIGEHSLIVKEDDARDDALATPFPAHAFALYDILSVKDMELLGYETLVIMHEPILPEPVIPYAQDDTEFFPSLFTLVLENGEILIGHINFDEIVADHRTGFVFLESNSESEG